MVIIYVTLEDNVKSDDVFWSKFKLGVQDFKSSLPSGVAGIFVSSDFGSVSALLISIESKEKTYRELENYLTKLEDQLRTIPSVSNLRRYGIQNEQISVYIDKKKLVKYGIDVNELTSMLYAQNFTTISGTFETDDCLAPLHVSETYASENDVAEQIIYADPTGSIIRLKDIARIVREYPEPTSYIANGDKKCVLLSIEMQDGNNIVEYGKAVKAELEKFEKTLPPEVSVFRVADQAEVVHHSVNMFLREMLIAIITVILVIMIMQPLRVASIAAMTIPITMFIALGFLYLLGYEINTVTLGALLVVLGIIVDDSVVVIDNYVEKLGHGIPRWEATLASGTELFKSVLSATLAITLTFFPLLMTCTGIFGEFLETFPGTITITLFISLLIAMLFIPFVQYAFIKKGFNESEKNQRFNIAWKIQKWYDKLIHIAFRIPKITVITAILAVVIGCIVFIHLPQRMMPATERNQFVVEIYMPTGTPFAQTEQICNSVANTLRRDPRITNVTSFVGCSAPRFHMCYAPKFPSKQYAQLIITTSSETMTNTLLDEYEDKFIDFLPKGFIRFKQLDYVATAFPIEIEVIGTNRVEVEQVEQKIITEMRKRTDLLMVTSSGDEMCPGIFIDINHIESNRLGITKPMIMTNLAFSYGAGIPITSIWEEDYPVKVVLKSETDSTRYLTDLSDEYIASLSGQSVPLRQFAETKPDWSPGKINHKNGVYCATVQADVKRNKNVTWTTHDIDNQILKNLELPDDVDVVWGGSRKQDDIVMPQIFSGLTFSVFILFTILLFHFKSIKLSILILCAVTLSIFGAAVGIWLMQMPFTITSVLGLIALMGIIVRNGIIMYDYAEDLRLRQGHSAYDAALEAGKRRMRPIFLTSAAASMGVVPMIASHSALWSPMGVVICFGTWISMLFVVTALPVLYWLANAKTPIIVTKNSPDNE